MNLKETEIKSLDDLIALGVRTMRAQVEAERERERKAAEARLRKAKRMLEEVKERLPEPLRERAEFSHYELGSDSGTSVAWVLIDLPSGGCIRYKVQWAPSYEVLKCYFGHMYEASSPNNRLYHTDDISIAVAWAMGALQEVLS